MEAGAEMVKNALVQEGVNRAVSFVLGKRKERPSQGDLMERLEMAVNEVESVVKTTAKMPITGFALINRRKMLKQAYMEGADLLSRHRNHQQAAAVLALALQNEDQAAAAAATFSTLARRWVKKKVSSISPLFGWNKSSDDMSLSCDDIRRYEWFADCARHFLRDLESGYTLRHYTFCNPLVRYLLEGKTLTYQLVQRDVERRLHIRAVFLEDLGVVAELSYEYSDHGRPEKSFELEFTVQVSESTDIVAVGIRCLEAFPLLQSTVFLETAKGEFTLVANSQAISRTYVPMQDYHQGLFAKDIESMRPNPTCCTTNSYRHRSCPFPDHQVIQFRSVGYTRRLVESDGSRSSSEEASTSVVRHEPTPYDDLLLQTCVFIPHCEGLTEGVVLEVLGTERSHRYESVQNVERVEVPEEALNQFCKTQQGIINIKIGWGFQHGCFTVEMKTPITQNGSQCKLIDSKAKGKEALQEEEEEEEPEEQEEKEKEASLPFILWHATDKQLARLRLAHMRLYHWYVERRGCVTITARYKAEHFLSEPGFFRLGIDDFMSNLWELHGMLGVGLIGCWTLYMMVKHNKDPVRFLDPQLVCEDSIRRDASKVEEYVTKAMLQHQDKIYILPYNFQSNWILIFIDLKYSVVEYLDSMNNSPEDYKLVTELIDRSFAMCISNKEEDTPRQTTMKHYHQLPCHQQPKNGINACGFYVCHHMQEILGAKIELGMIEIPTCQLLTSEIVYIQGQLADFLLSSVIDKEGEFHDPDVN